MKVLLTGANGYIGSRLLPVLINEGHQVVALVRDANRLNLPAHLKEKVEVIVGDLLTGFEPPQDIEAAYYLVHSMAKSASGFAESESQSARNFCEALSKTQCKQIIYLSGLSHGDQLSEHLQSRLSVQNIFNESPIPATVLRAGIIIGSGGASFEIIRDLVEKLPIMVAPKWVKSRCQPIAIADVIYYLVNVLGNEQAYKTFDIGGPDVLTYAQMLKIFAKLRKLIRFIIPVPVLTPRLSSYWLFFVTSTNFALARALVQSLKHDAICRESSIHEVLPHQCLTYNESLLRAFEQIEQNAVISSWKDAMGNLNLAPYVEVPRSGCLKEEIKLPYKDRDAAIETLWRIGGNTGWYSMNWAWRIRGMIDRLIGGNGLRRGRTDPSRLRTGDALDFWRVLHADKEKGDLLLFSEMKVPGEAWLEYHIADGHVTQIATFRPRGVLGRLYWYAMVPFHFIIFKSMCRSIATGITRENQPPNA